MAKYDTTLVRNPRQIVLRDIFRSGKVYLCSGSVPGTLATPGSGNILSEHAIGASAGSVASGKLTLADADVSADASANNSGTPTYAVFEDSSQNPVAQYAIPSQMTLVINGGASQTITQGVQVDVDLIEIIEGNG